MLICPMPIQISLAPPGTQACTLDIAKFHRTCPVLPSHKPWLVVQGRDGDFYIDHAFPFGAASASSNAGMIANATVDIWLAEAVAPICKYEDDLKIFRTPSPAGAFLDGNLCYDYDVPEVLRRIAHLGIPWHPDKCDDTFAFVTTFIGFQWDIPAKTVSLPEHKRLKFLERVRQFLDRFDGHRCSLRDVEKIHGSLCHVAFVHMEGCSHLPSLSNFAASFKGDAFLTRYPPPSVFTDLRWWHATLLVASASRLLIPRGPIQDLGIFVDASTSWGIGVLISGDWATFRLLDGWKIPGRDICWLETLAIEFAVYLLEARGARNASILIHSDNQGTMGAVDKGRSGNHHINSSIRRIYSVLFPLHISPEVSGTP